jgi:predicted Zn finger-like uncharacterized protein
MEQFMSGQDLAQVTNRPRATRQSVLIDASGAGSLNVSDQRFGVDQTNEPIPKGSGEQSSAPSVPPSDRADKIVVVCPSCQATLRVRRVYIGNPVRCKQCEHVFTVAPPLELDLRPAEEVTRNNVESPARQTETEREIRRLNEELDRVTTERNDLGEKCDLLTIELNEIRASLGEVAPAQVRPLAEERDSLRAQVLRLGDEIRDLRADQSAHARLAAELEQHVEELNVARHELALLGGKLEERGVELDSARALHTGLSREHQTAIEEMKALQATLDERDQAIRLQADQHHAELESHVQTIDHARQLDREAIERVQAELVALGARHGRLQEELNARDDLCTQLQARILELEKDQERIESEYQSMIEAERWKQNELSEACAAPTAELQTALAQVKDLQEWLTESERLNRDMAALLENVGIVYSPPVRR